MEEVYGAGWTVFTVDFRITAVEAFYTHVNVVFGTYKRGLRCRVVDTFIHRVISSRFYLKIVPNKKRKEFVYLIFTKM